MTVLPDPQEPSRSPALRPTRDHMRLPGLRTVTALILREMAVSYGKSPGGYLWVVMEPALGIGLLVVIFSLGFRAPPLGDNFAIFYATGLLPFMMFNDLSSKTARAVVYSRNLLAYPRVTYLDAIVARLILGLLTQLAVAAILLTAILTIWETRTTLVVERIVLTYAMAFACAAGVGILNCFLMTMFPVWQSAWSIMTRPLFILSGVILLYEDLPRQAQAVLWYNPLMHITGEMRTAFYLGYEAKYVSPAYVFGTALVCALVGLVFLRRYHRDMMEI